MDSLGFLSLSITFSFFFFQLTQQCRSTSLLRALRRQDTGYGKEVKSLLHSSCPSVSPLREAVLAGALHQPPADPTPPQARAVRGSRGAAGAQHPGFTGRLPV